MNAPQIIMIALLAMSIGIGLAKRGEPRKEKHNFWLSVFCVFAEAGILYSGGFFS